jgi:ribosomal protein S12 methylthiotransferase accessory factor YcaO
VTAWPILNEQLFLATAYVESASGRIAGGACDQSSERASARAHSEAIERASLIDNGPQLVLTRQEALDRGLCPVVPHDILEDATDWVPARRATDAAGVAVPADVVLLGRFSNRLLPWKQSSVGTAAHPDRATAGVSGILECLERNAIRQVWAGTASLAPATDELRDLMPPGLAAAFEAQKLAAHAWHVSSLSPIRVSLVLVGRQDRAQATLGAGVGFDADAVLMHALQEAVSVRAALANRANANDPEFQRGVRAARHQAAFLSYLGDLEAPPPPVEGSVDPSTLPAFVEERFGVAPVLVDVPSLDALAVVKAVIPSADFLIPRHTGQYVLAPGYLE